MTKPIKDNIPLITDDNKLSIDLYHGTSTLFLDSIIQNGLGFVNPVKEWGLFELSKEVYKLSEKYLQDTNLFKNSSYSFKSMSEQSNSGSFNFQHGDTYLSPSKQTACRYAINKEYGSEILTYTIDFLKELLKKEIDYVKEDLFNKYPKIFELIKENPTPILIQISNTNIDALLSEHGGAPNSNLEFIQENINVEDDIFQTITQQTNFRLTIPIQKNQLTVYRINVQKRDSIFPQYTLNRIKLD